MIWQVAAGSPDRDYADLCLKFGVILNGPGWAGAWPQCEAILREDQVSARKLTDLRRFCEVIAEDDVIVLRVGTNRVFGVGIVVGNYEWKPVFSDVDGWSLEHTRRVNWVWGDPANPATFDVYTLNLGDTVQALTSATVADWATTKIPSPVPPPQLPSFPPLGEPLQGADLVKLMFDYGVGGGSVNETAAQISDLVRLAQWYQRFGPPSEREIVAQVVVPLLRTLGWTAQRTAVEWNAIDVALFDSVPRRDGSLAIVVEVKGLHAPILRAFDQALGYAREQRRDACRRLILTNGFRYGVFILGGDGNFARRPSAYLNLTNPMSRQPLLDCDGADKALLYMSADWRPGAAAGAEAPRDTAPENL